MTGLEMLNNAVQDLLLNHRDEVIDENLKGTARGKLMPVLTRVFCQVDPSLIHIDIKDDGSIQIGIDGATQDQIHAVLLNQVAWN